MKSKLKETEVQAQILEYLQLKGMFVWRNDSVGVYDATKKTYRRKSKFCMNGVADIIGIYKSKFLAIEVKTGYNKPSDNQKKFLERVNREGGIAFVAYSLDDVINNLKEV